MFKSTKITESPRSQNINLQNQKLLKTTNDAMEGIYRTLTTPKRTSTPLRINVYATPPKPHLLSPRRYSLSDIATPPRVTKRDPINRSNFVNISGPLLASTKCNIDISTYEETKSPGFARRIVQYNQEAEREKKPLHPPTHQAKYGSPGLFPIVHLFKKSASVLEQRPKRVKVRISSPGYTRYQSEEYKLKLLDEIVKPRTVNNISHGYQQHSAESNTSTRSVLDALKEISRKRIHASEEYEINEDSGKRQRTDFLNGSDSNKRTRDETSPLMDSPTSHNKPISKRACMYDEYVASCSSTIHSFKKPDVSGSKRKSISTSTLTESPKELKQVKLINAETQTILEEQNKAPLDDKRNPGHSEAAIRAIDQPLKTSETPLKVFDDAPLERIRKNRLAALMGSLTGKDPVLTPKPTFSSVLDGSSKKSESNEFQNITNESDRTSKPLVSILTSNKLSHKSDKHVHFDIPETSISASSSESLNLIHTTLTKSLVPVGLNEPSKNKIASTAAPPSFVNLKPAESITLDISTTPNSVVSLQPTVSSQETYIQTKNTSSNTSTSISVKSLSTSSLTAPQLTLNAPTAIASFESSASKPTFLASTNTSPVITKPGGFKFDLSPSKSRTNTSTLTSTQLGYTGITFGETTSEVSSTQSFGLKPTIAVAATTSTGLTFGTTTTASSTGPLSSSTASPFKLGGFSSESNTKPQIGIASVMSKNEITNIITVPTFSVMSTKSTISSTGIPQTIKTPTFSFGSVNSTSSNAVTTSTSTFSFSTSKPITTTTIASNAVNSSFGTISSSSTVSSGSTSTLVTSSISSGFGNVVPTFVRSNIQNGFGMSSSNTGFGSVATISGFGTVTNISSSFGTPTTAIGGFGTPSSNFTPTTTSVAFGSSNNVTDVSSGFGTKTLTAPTFGAFTNSTGFAFAAPNTTSNGFRTPATTRTFGTTDSVPRSFDPMTTTTTDFGNSSLTSSSRNNSESTFGQNNVSSPFGATATTSFGTNGTFNSTTITSSVFGGSTGFGVSANNNATNIFGGLATTQISGFGVSNSMSAVNSPFGNATTTTATSFATNSAPVFSFGAKTTTTSANSFGSTSTSGFGSTLSSFGNTFGGNTFGTSNNSNFGATTTQSNGFSTQSGFGAPNQGFGTENKPLFGNTTSSFGANSAGSSFGTTAPSTGFGTSTNHLPTFGTTTSNSTFGKPQTNTFNPDTPNNFDTTGFGPNQGQSLNLFGNSNIPATNSASVFNFGSGVAAPPGVFSFGNASASEDLSKPNFNFNGGTVASSTFGASSSFTGAGAPSFAATGTPQFGAQASAPGMFSIGSGSPSTRNRTVIRAKRRT